MSQMSRNPQAYDIIWIFNLQCDGAITKDNESTNGIDFELTIQYSWHKWVEQRI